MSQPQQKLVEDLTIAQSAFEGLFARALTPSPEFREDLRRIGYDMERQDTKYSPDVWNAALQVAVRYEYPQLPKHDALRKLGGRFIEGYFQTIAGRFVGTALPIVGAEGLMKRLHRFWGSGAPGTRVETKRLGEGDWRIDVTHPYPQADFDMGMFEVGLRRTRVEISVEMIERRVDGYSVRVRWTDPRR